MVENIHVFVSMSGCIGVCVCIGMCACVSGCELTTLQSVRSLCGIHNIIRK